MTKKEMIENAKTVQNDLWELRDELNQRFNNKTITEYEKTLLKKIHDIMCTNSHNTI